MVKRATAAFPVWAFLALRFGLAALVLLPFGWRRLRRLGWRGWGAGALIGVFSVGRLCLSDARPAAHVGLQGWLYHRPLGGHRAVALGLGVATAPALCRLSSAYRWPRLAWRCSRSAGAERASRGDVLVLFCALSFALHIVSISALGAQRDPLALTFVQVLTVAVLSAIVSLFVRPPLACAATQHRLCGRYSPACWPQRWPFWCRPPCSALPRPRTRR